MKLTLPDKSVKELPKGVTGLDVAMSIGPGLAKSAIAVNIDGEQKDLSDPINADCSLSIITLDSDEGLEIMRHTTAAQVLALAIKSIYPDSKLAIGPTIADGFYYDIFDIFFLSWVWSRLKVFFVSIDPERDTPEIIKDYLSKDLFADIKRISFTDEKPSEDDKHEALSDEYQGTFNDISENQIISAKVIGISDSDVMVDIGFKSEGLINRSEFDNKDLPEIGSNIDIFLEKFEDTDGNITLSKYKADFIKRWGELKAFCDSGEPVKGKIIKRVKGGMVVDLGVIQAFLPGSQVDVQPVKNFDDFLNKEFDFQQHQ